ncbi:hypothetical protein B0H13DRAFT_2304978 [Mycena leptocephala]|nr:hypothetical protein B0H13DRAFT_2304978 [Mycena leptocephala]
MRLSVFDVLHRGVVYSLMGISGWAVFVGVYGHRERKAAMMEKVKETNSTSYPVERMAAADQKEQEQMALARAAQGVVPSKTSS